MKKQAKNILGEDLVPCGLDPITGFYRDGFLRLLQQQVMIYQHRFLLMGFRG
jgi:uncharacterized protein (DUF2237 family)